MPTFAVAVAAMLAGFVFFRTRRRSAAADSHRAGRTQTAPPLSDDDQPTTFIVPIRPPYQD